MKNLFIALSALLFAFSVNAMEATATTSTADNCTWTEGKAAADCTQGGVSYKMNDAAPAAPAAAAPAAAK